MDEIKDTAKPQNYSDDCLGDLSLTALPLASWPLQIAVTLNSSLPILPFWQKGAGCSLEGVQFGLLPQ